jgi:hypothetical protein
MACGITVAGGGAFLASSDSFPGHIVANKNVENILVLETRYERQNELYAKLFDRIQPSLNLAMFETRASIADNLASMTNPMALNYSYVIASNE